MLFVNTFVLLVVKFLFYPKGYKVNTKVTKDNLL